MSASTASSSRSLVPLDDTITGSTTTNGSDRVRTHLVHCLDGFPVHQHAGLDCGHTDVTRDRFDLRTYHVGRHDVNGRDALGILGGDRRHGADPMDTEGGERFEVGLDSCAAARVTSGDGESRVHRWSVLRRRRRGSSEDQ